MATSKKTIRKAAPKSRKSAPKATKKKIAPKASKRPVSAKSTKPKSTKPIARKAAPMVRVASGPKLPRYNELPIRAGAPKGAAWGVFGDDDEVGTINLQTPDRVVAAASSIRSGKVFALNLPINIPDPPLFTRGKHTHTVKIFPTAEFVLDDYLDNFYPQASSQCDALSHVKHPVFGAYNGIPDAQITGRGGMRLGIDNLARRGIAGRGVLADVARYYDRVGKSIDFTRAESIPLEDGQATLDDAGVTLQAGDLLLIPIGWTNV